MRAAPPPEKGGQKWKLQRAAVAPRWDAMPERQLLHIAIRVPFESAQKLRDSRGKAQICVSFRAISPAQHLTMCAKHTMNAAQTIVGIWCMQILVNKFHAGKGCQSKQSGAR